MNRQRPRFSEQHERGHCTRWKMLSGRAGFKMRMFCVVIICLAAASSISMAQTSPPNLGVQNAQCTLKPEQSPALRGFRLGMMLSEVKAKAPKLDVGSTNNGGTPAYLLNLSGASEPDKTKYSGVEHIYLGFLDERLVSVRIDYVDAPWSSTEQFTSAVSDKLALPRAWEDDRLKCNGWEVRVSTNGTFISFSVLGTDEILRKRQREKEDLQRRAFQP